MKKSMKYFLIGAGATVVGFIVYSLLKEPKDAADTTSTEKEVAGTPLTPNNTHALSKEYVEHRRDLMIEKAAVKAAATVAAAPSPVEAEVLPVVEEKPAGITQDPQVFATTSEEQGVMPPNNLDPVVEGEPAVIFTEQQELTDTSEEQGNIPTDDPKEETQNAECSSDKTE